METLDYTFDKEYQKKVIKIIKASLKGDRLADGEIYILFHWVRNMNEPIYSFVPKRLRNAGGPNNGISRGFSISTKKRNRSN
jgi:hypothetical protein